MNKRIFLLAIIVLCCAFSAAAQALITFHLKPNDQENIPENVRTQLDDKIKQALTKYNLLSGGADGVLVVESKLVLNNSVPAGMESEGITMARGQLTLSVKNMMNDAVYFQTSKDVHANVQGDMAAAQAEVVNRLSVTDPIWGRFVTNGRLKVNEYFTNNSQEIMKKAESLYQSKKYKLCKAYLFSIPTTVSYYNKVKFLFEQCSEELAKEQQTQQ